MSSPHVHLSDHSIPPVFLPSNRTKPTLFGPVRKLSPGPVSSPSVGTSALPTNRNARPLRDHANRVRLLVLLPVLSPWCWWCCPGSVPCFLVRCFRPSPNRLSAFHSK